MRKISWDQREGTSKRIWIVKERESRITTLAEKWFLPEDVLTTEERYHDFVFDQIQPPYSEMYVVTKDNNIVSFTDIEGDIIDLGNKQKFRRVHSTFR